MPAKVTRHFPTLLYVVAKRAACMEIGSDPAGQSDFLGVLVNDGSNSAGLDGTKDESRAARLRG